MLFDSNEYHLLQAPSSEFSLQAHKAQHDGCQP